MTLVGETSLPASGAQAALAGAASARVPLRLDGLRRPEGLVIIGLSAGQPVREFHLTASPGQASVAVRFPDNAEMFSVHTGGQPAGVKEVNGTSSPDAVSPSTSFVQNLGTPWETIGGTYAKTTGGYQLFTFVHGANTTVGVGESASGAFGSFSADGTGTMTSGSTTTFPLQWDYQGSNHWYVEVTESESLTKCYQSLTGQTLSSYYSVSDNIYGVRRSRSSARSMRRTARPTPQIPLSL